MAFSDRASQTIGLFAGSLGLSATPAADGSFSFAFERSGLLTLTASEDGERCLASLAKRPVRLDERVERRVIELAGPDPSTRRFLSAGLDRGGSVVVAVSIDDDELDLPILEACLQQLISAQSAIG
ncbi:MAG: hypothetical protein H7Y08_06270 [Rhizobiaceae bacterium]|nr:hypothetical protein [Rhizobiaceae bacterium]